MTLLSVRPAAAKCLPQSGPRPGGTQGVNTCISGNVQAVRLYRILQSTEVICKGWLAGCLGLSAALSFHGSITVFCLSQTIELSIGLHELVQAQQCRPARNLQDFQTHLQKYRLLLPTRISLSAAVCLCTDIR